MATLITVNNASRRVGQRRRLRVEKLEIRQGEHWCFFGPNGSGKSLLANLLAKRHSDFGGSVIYLGGFEPSRDVHVVSFEEQQRLWERDNRLDMSEYADDVKDLGTTVLDLIKGSRPPKHEDSALLSKLIEQLLLGDYVRKGIRFLSSGQVRRALIARALYAFQPSTGQLLILDDPLESIDINAQLRVRDTISEFLRDGFSSIQLCRRHSDILPVATHLAVMESLHVVQQGVIDEVKKSESYVRLLSREPNLVRKIPGKESDKDIIEDQELLIKMTNISASYGGVTIFKGFDWSMRRGDYVLIEGPNGCGKSTLLSLINGENHKAYGQNITLFGRRKGSGETIWELKEKFGVVSNELHNKYIKGWKVLEVVVSGFFDSVGLYDESGTTEKEVATEWLSTLGIDSLASDYYHEVSFGEQRLILLARAMVKRPKILILDEPCVGLDDYYRQLILNVLDLIADQTRTNLIYVSHVKDEKPRCINVHLSFERNNDGSFRIITHSV
jgi:molybdate transport system ATP-binding protein